MGQLPKIDVPLYDLTLPLTKKKIRFRPFLVKEEKILLLAVESEDEKATLLAIKQIVNNCCVDELDVDNIPMTDLEFIFLNLRARSINEVVELQYKCNNKVAVGDTEELKVCANIVKFEVNLLEIKPEVPEDHTNKITISPKIGIVMKYPSFKTYEKVDKSKSEMETMIELFINCIDYIYDENTIYYSKDTTKEELHDFIENLTQTQFEMVQQFFTSIPKIKTKVNFKCPKCQYEEVIEVEGIQNFFS